MAIKKNETPKSAQMHRGPGFRIRKDFSRPSAALVEEYLKFSTADISDILNRMYTMSTGIRNFTSRVQIAGPACTVKVFPGDNLMVHKVLDVAKPGDIVVIDAGESTGNGILGDLICNKAKHRGIKGFVVDGLFRDFKEVQELGFPVFARGVTPIGPLHRGPGEINFPVCCGGIVVNPGDMIVGDSDGVVVVRMDCVHDTMARLTAQRESAQTYEKNVKEGIFDNTWVDNLLNDAGCVIVD
jgi:RraA family protein